MDITGAQATLNVNESLAGAHANVPGTNRKRTRYTVEHINSGHIAYLSFDMFVLRWCGVIKLRTKYKANEGEGDRGALFVYRTTMGFERCMLV